MNAPDPPSRIHLGCSGWALAQEAYFRSFALLEVQQTFYHPPRPATLARWRERAPARFTFTLKAWQLITHEPSSPTYRRLRSAIPASERDRYGSFRPTDEVLAAWRVTREAADILRAPVIVFQCPAAFTPSRRHLDDMRGFFRAIDGERGDALLGWEPRGAWDQEVVAALCEELDLVLVVDPFVRPALPGPLRYFRLHGRDGFDYRYSDEELERVRAWCAGETYLLFNNVPMADDARRFAALVAAG